MTPEQFIPFWNALTINDRNRIKENLQMTSNPGSGFFSSKRFMRGGIVFLLQGNLRIFLSSNEGREITVMTMSIRWSGTSASGTEAGSIGSLS